MLVPTAFESLHVLPTSLVLLTHGVVGVQRYAVPSLFQLKTFL